VDDYLSEKEQWEWLKGQVRENAPAAVLAILVVAAGVFGWRWWQGHQDARDLAAGAKYMQMVQALERGDHTQPLVLLGELERDYGASPYTDQARLLAARMYVDAAQLDRAASELATVAEHSKDQELARVARLRLARVQIAQGKPESALATLGTQDSQGAFAGRYHEIRGDAYYAKGDKAAALTEYRSAQTANTEGTETALLQLKVADLLGGAPPAAAPAAANTAAPHTAPPAAGK
jgi:predicted negative regulator of RcsB-dependent stress response